MHEWRNITDGIGVSLHGPVEQLASSSYNDFERGSVLGHWRQELGFQCRLSLKRHLDLNLSQTHSWWLAYDNRDARASTLRVKTKMTEDVKAGCDNNLIKE